MLVRKRDYEDEAGENPWVRYVGTATGDRRRKACDPPVQVAVLFGYSLYLCFRLVAMISSSPL